MSNDLPQSVVAIQDGQLGAGFALGTKVMCVIGCAPSGVLNTPRMFTRVKDLVAAHGHCEAVEAAAQILQTGKPVLFVRAVAATAGSNSSVYTHLVTGTSVITLTGTPVDEFDGAVRVATGGTVETAGIEIEYSLDGQATWSPRIALGTAATYVIPNSGLTLNFAAGTLVAGDIATWSSTAPMWDATGLGAAFDALKAGTTLFVAAFIVGRIDGPDVDAIDAELEAMVTEKRRFTFAFASPRNMRQPARLTGNPNLTFDESGKTITRAAGSWLTDGFGVGDTLEVNSASNDGTFTIASLSATVITVSSGDTLADEGPTNGHTVTGIESEASWMASLRTDFDDEASARLCAPAGDKRLLSPISRRNYRRPAAWGLAARFMLYDIHVSLAEVQRGPIRGASLIDSEGNVESRLHDEQAVSGLLAGRFACLRTFDGLQGVYCALPLMLAPAGSDFSRVHYRAVMDVACTVTQQALQLVLGSAVRKNSAGRILEAEARRIERFVNRRLEKELLEKGRASAVVYTCSRDDDLNAPGAVLTGETRVTTLGYIEGASTLVAFQSAELSQLAA